MARLTPASRREGEEAARLLASLDGYKVLSRLKPLERRGVTKRWALPAGCAIALKTTGPDPRTDGIVELALRRFIVGSDGSIAETGQPRRWLECPEVPLSTGACRRIGLAASDFSGKAIQTAEATTILNDVDFIVVHNAAFFRRFVERRLPDLVGRPWCCSMAGVDWHGRGFDGRTLSHLLLQAGWFGRCNRSADDVEALIRLLDHRFEDGRTVVSELIGTAQVVGSAFDTAVREDREPAGAGESSCTTSGD